MRVRVKKANGLSEESLPLCGRVCVCERERKKVRKGRENTFKRAGSFCVCMFVFARVDHLINRHLHRPSPSPAGSAAEAAV